MFAADFDVLRYAAGRPVSGDLLNVGCYKGLSCSVLATIGPHLDCVDTWRGGGDLPDFHFTAAYSEWETNMKAHGIRDRISVHVGRSQDILPKLKAFSYRLIFIDAGHDYESVAADFRNAKLLIAKRGWVLFDDANWEGIERAAKEVFGADEYRLIKNTKLGLWKAP